MRENGGCKKCRYLLTNKYLNCLIFRDIRYGLIGKCGLFAEFLEYKKTK